MDKAVANIASNIGAIDDAYTEALAAYALQLADHPQKTEVLEKLLKKASSKSNCHSALTFPVLPLDL